MKSSIKLASALVTAAMSLTAIAGEKDTHEVTFDPNKPFVQGALGNARNSVDAVQYIGCQLNSSSALCVAVNSAGVTHSCSTTDPTMLANIRALNGDSWFAFKWDAVSGVCNLIMVWNDSRYAPK